MSQDKEIAEFTDALGLEKRLEVSELFTAAYSRLRGLAHAQRRHWPAQDTLSTTAIVHEAYLKLQANHSPRWQDRGHFFRVAARAMRHIVINYAKSRLALKRGGGSVHVPVEEVSVADSPRLEQLLSLDEALDRLEQLCPRQARVIECRFFAGLDIRETAETLDISPATVKRDWQHGQAWLYQQLESAEE